MKNSGAKGTTVPSKTGSKTPRPLVSAKEAPPDSPIFKNGFWVGEKRSTPSSKSTPENEPEPKLTPEDKEQLSMADQVEKRLRELGIVTGESTSPGSTTPDNPAAS